MSPKSPPPLGPTGFFISGYLRVIYCPPWLRLGRIWRPPSVWAEITVKIPKLLPIHKWWYGGTMYLCIKCIITMMLSLMLVLQISCYPILNKAIMSNGTLFNFLKWMSLCGLKCMHSSPEPPPTCSGNACQCRFSCFCCLQSAAASTTMVIYSKENHLKTMKCIVCLSVYTDYKNSNHW